MLFGLFLSIMAGFVAGCAPSGTHDPAAKFSQVYVEPPTSADPLAEAAHDAFVRALKQAGWNPMPSPEEAELRITLSFQVVGSEQSLVMTWDDPAGRRRNLRTGRLSRSFFWTASLAADEARLLASRLGPPPGDFGKGD